MNYMIRGYVKPYARFNLDRLVELAAIYAPSKMEEPVAQYLIPILERYCTSIQRDAEGNLCAWKPGDSGADTVLLCSHMDTVFFHELERVFEVEDGFLQLNQSKLPREPERGVPRPAVLGGDDRAGIEMILSILELYDGPLNLRVLFTTREEIGGEGIFDVKRDFLEGVKFGLVLDRRGTGDIITRISSTNLAPRSLISYVRHCGEVQNIRDLRETVGSFSDAFFLARRHRIPCVNLSVAYFYPHTSKEKIDLYAYDDCMGWVLRILDGYNPHILDDATPFRTGMF